VEYKIAPSLLAADFARLGEEVRAVEAEVDLLHLDLMDGHFVPNLSFGFPVLSSLRPVTRLPFDCHVMTTNPGDYLEELVEAGADQVTVHVEAVPDPTGLLERARSLGIGFGVVVSPPTPWAAVEPFAEACDLIVIMSVQPGFGGQSFMPEVLSKVEAARGWLEVHGSGADVEIDGGITVETAVSARDAGANVFVAGSSVFGRDDPLAAVRELRRVIEGAA
jgi:ribulose-phosphate 3-epimerase